MLKRILILLSGSLTAKGLQFFYFFWVVKELSTEEFGIYASCMTLYLIFLYPALEFGTELVITKSTAKGDSETYFQATYWKSISFIALAFPVLLIGKITYGFGIDILILASILTFFRSVEMGNAAYLRGSGLNKVESIHLSFSRVLPILMLTAWTYGLKEEMTVQWALGFQIIGMFISFILIERPKIIISRIPKFNKDKTVGMLKEGLPLALNSVAWLIYFKIDVLLIGKMVGVSEAGLYEVAYKILETTFVFPGVVMAVTFSHLLKCESFEKYRATFIKASCLLGGFGVLGTLITYFALPILFPFLFRENQQGVVGIYNILAWVIPFVFLAHLTTQTLVIQNKNGIYLKITLSAAVLNLILNFILISSFQAKGAAIATFITEAMILFCSGWFVLKGMKNGF